MAVNVRVSSTVTSMVTDNTFNQDLSIGELKNKLEMISGANASYMELFLYDGENVVCKMEDDHRTLASYGVKRNMRIHVVDKSGKSIPLDDLSSVPKFEISDELYAQKKDSVRAFKQKMKFGQFAEVSEEEKKEREEKEKRADQLQKEQAEKIKINDRCEVTVVGQPRKRGTVMFVGLADFKPGYWVGVKYDEPMGKNDGSVAGKRYFECLPNYGAFVKPENVTVGDFPELGFEEDEM